MNNIDKQFFESLKPSDIFILESMRETPFSCMFGCYENEKTAKQVIDELIENGDSWGCKIQNVKKYSNEHCHGEHGHNFIKCDFIDSQGIVTELFRQKATRTHEFSSERLPVDVIKKRLKNKSIVKEYVRYCDE